MRPSDLAREHGVSTQAVRNYEQDGYLPPAERTPSGYRVYTELHAAALRAYLALIPAHGYAASGQIMTALNHDQLDAALTVIDRGHSQLLHDRGTLETVRKAINHLTAEPTTPNPRPSTCTIGELAHRLRITPATVRNWERTGILTPTRDPAGYRVYRTADIRDAELAHLLRRGGYPLNHIATVVHQIRTAGGTDALATSLSDWQHKLTTQGLAMLTAARHVGDYLTVRNAEAVPLRTSRSG